MRAARRCPPGIGLNSCVGGERGSKRALEKKGRSQPIVLFLRCVRVCLSAYKHQSLKFENQRPSLVETVVAEVFLI